MRTFFLLFLFAVSATAQPSAADSALVERVVDAYSLDDVTAAIRPGNGTVAGGVGGAVREALYADLRPDLIRDALVTIEGPAHERVMAAEQAWLQSQGPEAVTALASGAVLPDGPMADSVLVAGYTRALLDATQPPDLQAEMMESARDALPDSTRDRLAALGVWGGLDPSSERARAQRRLQVAALIRISRRALAAVDPNDVDTLTAHYASDAGQYLHRRIAEGRLTAVLPALVESLESMAASRPPTGDGLGGPE